MTAKTEAKTEKAPACRVRAAGPSIRAAGHRFDVEPTAFAEGELSAEQYAALSADPRVVMLPPEPEPKGKG